VDLFTLICLSHNSTILTKTCFQLLTLAVLALIAGCQTPGQSLAKSAIDQIRDGTTTRVEIEKIFGEPRQMTKSPQGKTLYYYERFYGPSQSSMAFADEAHLMVLTVLFRPNDVVEKHLFSHTKPDVSRRMARAGHKFESADLARITPQKTTREELNSWFGPHWSEQLTLSGHVMVVWAHIDALNATGRIEMQALEVLMDDAGKVSTFRVTRRE
jgi:outer membrane protein assembly factor BamE (lipoprotein component of BamABCDE complex)